MKLRYWILLAGVGGLLWVRSKLQQFDEPIYFEKNVARLQPSDARRIKIIGKVLTGERRDPPTRLRITAFQSPEEQRGIGAQRLESVVSILLAEGVDMDLLDRRGQPPPLGWGGEHPEMRRVELQLF